MLYFLPKIKFYIYNFNMCRICHVVGSNYTFHMNQKCPNCLNFTHLLEMLHVSHIKFLYVCVD